MKFYSYDSVENFTELFSDIIASADADNPETGNNIVQGFFNALQDWRKYHIEAAAEHQRLIELATNTANDTESKIQG